MAKHTQQEILTKALEDLGYVQIESRTRKYRVFRKKDGSNPDYHVFVGKAGALRTGRTVSESHSTLPAVRRRLLQQGRALLDA